MAARIITGAGTAGKVLLGGQRGCCRFIPSCTHYAEEALLTHGLLHGGLLTIRRLVRCGPWSRGGFDPVPRRAGNGSE